MIPRLFEELGDTNIILAESMYSNCKAWPKFIVLNYALDKLDYTFIVLKCALYKVDFNSIVLDYALDKVGLNLLS